MLTLQVTACLVAALAAAALTPVARALAIRAGMLDHPGARSSHTRPTPRAGGLAVIVAMFGGSVVARAPWGPAQGALVAGALLVALVGLADDRFGVPAGLRLVAHLAAAALVVAAAGGLGRLPLPAPLDLPLGPASGLVVAVLWIVAVVNFYNFLDGIDGLAGLQGVITGSLLAFVARDPGASALGAAVAGASAGFLLHNWSPASVFLGDVGSGFLGYTLAALPLLSGPERRADSVWVVALSLWFFLADASWTLACRVAHGERWYEPHRRHAYQRLASGLDHGSVAGALGVAAAALTILAVSVRSMQGRWGILGVAVAAFAAELALARRCERRASPA